MVRDQLKEDASLAVRRLRDLGLATVMLTGDREEAAADIAGRTGVDRYWAGLLPEGKVAKIEDLQAGGKLAFVGDGINDAPALTRADVGIAMGGLGTDAAIEAADVVIDDKPSRVARAIEIAAFTRKIVIQNIVLALGVKGLFAAMGVLGRPQSGQRSSPTWRGPHRHHQRSPRSSLSVISTDGRRNLH